MLLDSRFARATAINRVHEPTPANSRTDHSNYQQCFGAIVPTIYEADDVTTRLITPTLTVADAHLLRSYQ